MKKAIITGVSGQDGTYLTKFLLEKGYEVHGFHHQPLPAEKFEKLRKLVVPADANAAFRLHLCGLESIPQLTRNFSVIEPDEIYNLAGQSNFGASFVDPEHTGNVNGMGVMRLLEAVRKSGLERKAKVFQAASSELFGNAKLLPQNEDTPLHPRSPYAVAKIYAYWFVKSYRELYGIHASNGILFNHESPLRSEQFVTRKITKGVAAIARGKQDVIALGNIDAQRDWSHARDFVDGMWRMLQAEHPDDYVLATGVTHTVREFVELAFSEVDITLRWTGSGLTERGLCTRTGVLHVVISPEFYRPADKVVLVGDPSKALTNLGWRPTTNLKALVAEMVAADLDRGDVTGEQPA
ncbi:MAG: GDP-mannose 4,6-dehydratase [Hyphomicrobium sp.]